MKKRRTGTGKGDREKARKEEDEERYERGREAGGK